MDKLDVVLKLAGEVGKSVEKHLSENEDLQKTLFGTYSNGEPRSFTDAIFGEVVHPKDKLAITKRLKKHDKKKKKRKKKGKPYGKIDLDKISFWDN